MNLKIDNLDGYGPRDYSTSVDTIKAPTLVRRLNSTSELQFSLIADGPEFVVPVAGARVTLGRMNGGDVFTGYLTEAPLFEYLGYGEKGPIYRYNLVAQSDDAVLDRKRLPDRSPFVDRSAGDALRLLVKDVMPGTTIDGIADVELMSTYNPSANRSWSQHAAEIALRTRSCYRAQGGAVTFHPLGSSIHVVDESDPDFCPEGLTLTSPGRLLNDVTLIGDIQPDAFVKDYFCGDGYTLRFYLSQSPFVRFGKTIVDEEYANTSLESTLWSVADPTHAISISAGKLQIGGGTGVDGQTSVSFTERIELGGACSLQHGTFTFSGASDGIIGGLYSSAISKAGCIAGFRITPSGSQSKIQAWFNGAATGSVISTTAGHQYALRTRFYSTQVFRKQESFHSSVSPAGTGRGGGEISADVRIVLEVHDIDPNNPSTLVSPSIVLYDGVLASAPAFCIYALLNAGNVNGTIAFTRLLKAVDAEVRSALPDQSFRTRLVGSLSEGDECLLTSDPALQFFPSYVPAPGERIEVRYRGSSRAMARVKDLDSIAALSYDNDDGTRGAVIDVLIPEARTAQDCENAALALLDDSTQIAWSGTYRVWSDFLAAEDVFPGDRLDIKVPSRKADFSSTVRTVEITVRDLEGEHSEYTIRFANDAAETLAFQLSPGRLTDLSRLTDMTVDTVGATFLSDLTGAEIIDTSSTTVTVDVGLVPASGHGIEVRRSDMGWGTGNDRNLIGRFTTQTFILPRLSRVQDYFLRQYDSSSPAKYSRYSTALHLDIPL